MQDWWVRGIVGKILKVDQVIEQNRLRVLYKLWFTCLKVMHLPYMNPAKA